MDETKRPSAALGERSRAYLYLPTLERWLEQAAEALQ
jgi:hypothetical protein